MVCGMHRTELNFSAPRAGFQLRSLVRGSKPFVENRSLILRRISITALWDTGAVVSAISRHVADRIGLKAQERTLLGSAAGVVHAFKDIVLLDLFIDDSVIPVKAAIVDSIPGQGNDFLIGMDVIQCGDLSITTDHTKDEFIVSFKPYPGLFSSMTNILPKSSIHLIDI